MQNTAVRPSPLGGASMSKIAQMNKLLHEVASGSMEVEPYP